jgi:hypothetical protein
VDAVTCAVEAATDAAENALIGSFLRFSRSKHKLRSEGCAIADGRDRGRGD